MCPFNSLHWTKFLAEHKATCPDRRSFEIKKDPNFTSKETCNVPCDEQWPDSKATYNPGVKTETSNVVRKPPGLMTRSQKRAYRERERVRLNKLRDTDQQKDDTANKGNEKPFGGK